MDRFNKPSQRVRTFAALTITKTETVNANTDERLDVHLLTSHEPQQDIASENKI